MTSYSNSIASSVASFGDYQKGHLPFISGSSSMAFTVRLTFGS